MPGFRHRDLPKPKRRYNLRRLISDFPSAASKRKEQQRRRKMLRAAAKKYPDQLDGRACLRLARRLKQVRIGCRQRCSSPVYMRDRLLRYGSAILQFAESEGAAFDEARFVTIWCESLRLEPEELAEQHARRILNKHRMAIKRAAESIVRTDGWLILFLDGDYDGVTGLLRLHFHGLGAGGLLTALDEPLREVSDYSANRAVKIEPIKSRARVISYSIKSFWKAPRPPGAKFRGFDRVPEPMHSQVLLWLDQYEAHDLCLMMNLRLGANGRIERT